jgi:hypothetical protein
MDLKYVLGLDLGQAQDFTALAVLELAPALDQAGQPLVNHAGHALTRYDVVHLERYALGASYPSIVADVAALMRRPELRPTNPTALVQRPLLVLDATGVGRPIVDLFRDELRGAPVELQALTITAGEQARKEYWGGMTCHYVPKRELVGTTQALLARELLKVVPSLAHAETLKRELLNFKVKVTPAANEVFGAWREGTHDDLVLAVAMAAWVGEHRGPEGFLPVTCASPRTFDPLGLASPRTFDPLGLRRPWVGWFG